MPALSRAVRVGEKAAHLGLDWPDVKGPRDKLSEELAELDAAMGGSCWTVLDADQAFLTADLRVEFLRSCRPGILRAAQKPRVTAGFK